MKKENINEFNIRKKICVYESPTVEQKNKINNIDNIYVSFIFTNPYAINNRNSHEQIKIIDKLIENSYNMTIYNTFINVEMLLYRTSDKQISLINKLIKSNYNSNMNIIINNCYLLKKYVLKNK